MTTTRAACYARISDPAEEDGESLRRQEAACRAYCQEHGYAVVAVHRDAKTGTAFRNREGLRELRQAAARGEFDVVVIRDLDRLTRHQAHLYLFMEECEHADVRVEFVNERFEDTAEGRLLRSVRAYVAEIEREKIVWRTQNGRRERVRAGKPIPSGRPPFGYAWTDAEMSRLRPDADAAAVVQRIFRACADGRPLSQIATGLASDGIRSPGGRDRWARAVLSGLIRHSVYKGQPAAYRWMWVPSRGGKGHTRLRPEEDWVALPPGTAPAIVAPALWDRANAALDGRIPTTFRQRASSSRLLLRGGFARCAACGTALSASASRGFRYYRCRQNQRVRDLATAVDGCPAPVRISAARLDAAAWAHVETLLGDEDLWTALSQAARERHRRRRREAAAEAGILDRRLAEHRRRMANLSRQLSLLDDDAAAAPHLAQLKALAGELRALERQRADLVTGLSKDADEGAEAGRAQEMALWRRNVLERLGDLHESERRDVLTILGVTVRVRPAGKGPGGRRRRWDIADGLGLR